MLKCDLRLKLNKRKPCSIHYISHKKIVSTRKSYLRWGESDIKRVLLPQSLGLLVRVPSPQVDNLLPIVVHDERSTTALPTVQKIRPKPLNTVTTALICGHFFHFVQFACIATSVPSHKDLLPCLYPCVYMMRWKYLHKFSAFETDKNLCAEHSTLHWPLALPLPSAFLTTLTLRWITTERVTSVAEHSWLCLFPKTAKGK